MSRHESAREGDEAGEGNGRGQNARHTASRNNLELKARCSSLHAAEAVARSIGAAFQGILRQEDRYFHVPQGRLKIRQREGGRAELIQYERPEKSAERWSNYIATPLTDAAAMIEALDRSLGTRAVVKKERRLYLVEGARIHLDDVEGLGTFLEFEVTVEEPAAAEKLMAFLRKSFGIGEEAVLRCSYADLLLSGA